MIMMKDMIELTRQRYLSMIEPFIDDGGMIKVLTGSEDVKNPL